MSAAPSAAESLSENCMIVARAIAIARECLAGDPFRDVLEIEVEAAGLFEQYDLGRSLSAWEESKIRRSPLPAYAVAADALQTARMAGKTLARGW